MLIGVISDIHDHLEPLRAALERLRGAGAEALICCGDLCSPFVIAELAQGFPAGPIHIVFGNNDGDRFRIAVFAARHKDDTGARRVEVHGESVAMELGSKRIFVHHFNDVGALIAPTTEFDAVCYGHNHEWTVRRHPTGSLEINPGAIMGWHPTRGPILSTYALYNSDTHSVTVFDTNSGEVVGSADQE